MTTSVNSPADVVNLSLGRIGYKLRVGSLYDGSPASKAALDIYGQTRDEQLRLADWGFAQGEVQLTLQKVAPVGGYVPGDPSTDNGCEIQDILAYWQRTGVGGHKIAAYAALGDCTNLMLMKQCLQIFGTVYLGINCPESAESQFSAGEVWTVVPGSPIAGGHAIPLQRWDNAPLGDLEVVTWGALQRMTMAFATEYVEEAWVPVSTDWITANDVTITGLDLAQLEADLAAV